MKLLEFTISSGKKDWGTQLILRPMPIGQEPWGILAPLKATGMRKLIPEVSGEVYSHALHGHVAPLMQQIGPDPASLLRRAHKLFPECSERKSCIAWTDKCHPGPKLPDCFNPIEGLDDSEQKQALITVLTAWRDNRYVVIVVGEEFSL